MKKIGRILFRVLAGTIGAAAFIMTIDLLFITESDTNLGLFIIGPPVLGAAFLYYAFTGKTVKTWQTRIKLK